MRTKNEDGRQGGEVMNVRDYKVLKAIWNEKEKEFESLKEIVHCKDCTIKKAVPHKDGIVWRFPHRTGDVKPEGYCESGVRADGS